MLFSWANKQLERLSETIAPPSSSSPSDRFFSSLATGDENLALSYLHGQVTSEDGTAVNIDPNAILNISKGSKAIHVSCQNCCINVARTLMTEFNVSPDTFDYNGNTALHYAVSSIGEQRFNLVQMLVNEFNATVTLKNSSNKTSYDVCRDTRIRQYLLPLQLQRETASIIQSGGALPLGTDMGGYHRASSVNYQSASASQSLDINNSTRRTIPVDGFHSSSSDVDLQKKYGHAPPTINRDLPPPPTFTDPANTVNTRAPIRNKYLAYDPLTGAASMPTSGLYPTSQPPTIAPHSNPSTGNVSLFSPYSAPQNVSNSNANYLPPSNNISSFPPPSQVNDSAPISNPPQVNVSVHNSYNIPSQISSFPPPSNEASSTPAQVDVSQNNNLPPQNNVSSFPPPPQFNVSAPSNIPPPSHVSSLPPPPQFNISQASVPNNNVFSPSTPSPQHNFSPPTSTATLPNNNAFSPSTPPVIPSSQHNFPPPTTIVQPSDQYDTSSPRNTAVPQQNNSFPSNPPNSDKPNVSSPPFVDVSRQGNVIASTESQHENATAVDYFSSPPQLKDVPLKDTAPISASDVFNSPSNATSF